MGRLSTEHTAKFLHRNSSCLSSARPPCLSEHIWQVPVFFLSVLVQLNVYIIGNPSQWQVTRGPGARILHLVLLSILRGKKKKKQEDRDRASKTEESYSWFPQNLRCFLAWTCNLTPADEIFDVSPILPSLAALPHLPWRLVSFSLGCGLRFFGIPRDWDYFWGESRVHILIGEIRDSYLNRVQPHLFYFFSIPKMLPAMLYTGAGFPDLCSTEWMFLIGPSYIQNLHAWVQRRPRLHGNIRNHIYSNSNRNTEPR